MAITCPLEGGRLRIWPPWGPESRKGTAEGTGGVGRRESRQDRPSLPWVRLCVKQLGPGARAKKCSFCASASWGWGSIMLPRESSEMCVTSLGVRTEPKGTGLGSQGQLPLQCPVCALEMQGREDKGWGRAATSATV